ncbi:hypothetical protein LTR95_007464 [Oleoguttula sp. CCFEE 5521]
MEDQQAFYEAQAGNIHDLFYAEEVEWSALTPPLDTALDNPLLPHLNQANLEAIHALSADESAHEHIGRARQTIRSVLEDKDQTPAEITRLQAPLNTLVNGIEAKLKDPSTFSDVEVADEEKEERIAPTSKDEEPERKSSAG